MRSNRCGDTLLLHSTVAWGGIRLKLCVSASLKSICRREHSVSVDEESSYRNSLSRSWQCCCSARGKLSPATRFANDFGQPTPTSTLTMGLTVRWDACARLL